MMIFPSICIFTYIQFICRDKDPHIPHYLTPVNALKRRDGGHVIAARDFLPTVIGELKRA